MGFLFNLQSHLLFRLTTCKELFDLSQSISHTIPYQNLRAGLHEPLEHLLSLAQFIVAVKIIFRLLCRNSLFLYDCLTVVNFKFVAFDAFILHYSKSFGLVILTRLLVDLNFLFS
jgi:hypothetical protein